MPFRRKGCDNGVFPFDLSSFCMAVLKVLLEFLRAMRFARDYIKRFPGCGASLLALLGRKLNAWWRFWVGKLEPFGRTKPAERPFLRPNTSSYSVPAAAREYVFAASSVPTSASHLSHHERTESQPETVAQMVGIHPPVPASYSVDHPHTPNSPHSLGGRSIVNRSSESLSAVSINSRARDRFSIITNSRESMLAPRGQPSQLPGAIHCQSESGLDTSPSRERLARPHAPLPLPRLETITSNLPSPTHGDGKVNPVIQPSTYSSCTHQPLCPPPMNETRRSQSSTPVYVDIQSPSTESLPISPMSFITATLDYLVPEGHFVRLINSDQTSRYMKDVTMQVGYRL